MIDESKVDTVIVPDIFECITEIKLFMDKNNKIKATKLGEICGKYGPKILEEAVKSIQNELKEKDNG